MVVEASDQKNLADAAAAAAATATTATTYDTERGCTVDPKDKECSWPSFYACWANRNNINFFVSKMEEMESMMLG